MTHPAPVQTTPQPPHQGIVPRDAKALAHPRLGEPVSVYEYQRSSGDTAFVVCRFEPKDFRPAQPRNGHWVWNLEGAPTLPYRLPELQRALASGETIWIVDGEKDADAIAAQGAVATCCARSQGWTLELAEQLTGARHINIVADRDTNGTGLRQAIEVRDLLVQAGAIASCDIELDQAAEGKDASDHLNAGLRLDQFQYLDEHPDQETHEAKPIIFEPLRAFLQRELPPNESLVGVTRNGTNLLPRYGWVMPWGREGSGKTSVLVDLLFHACTGISWLHYPIERPIRIVAIVNEGVPGGLQDKLRQKLELWEHDHDAVLDNLAIYASPWGEFTFRDAQMVQHARDYITDFAADYVALDPLHTLGTTGAGTPAETEEFKHLLRGFGLWNDLGVITAHHSNKSGMVSGDWGRHADTVIHLEKDGKQPATKLTLQKARPADPAELGVPCLLEWITESLGYRRIELQPVAAFDEEAAFSKAASALEQAREPLRKGDLVKAIGQTAEHARKAVDKWVRDGRIVDLTPTKRSFKLILPRSVEGEPTEPDGTVQATAQTSMVEPHRSVAELPTELDENARPPEGSSSVVRRSLVRETTEEDRTERANTNISFDDELPF